MTEVDKLTRDGPVVMEVESDRTGEVYQVRRREDGKLTCRCKGWIFRKTCKHTQAVVAAVAPVLRTQSNGKPILFVTMRPMPKVVKTPVDAFERAVRGALDEAGIAMSFQDRRRVTDALRRRMPVTADMRDRLETGVSTLAAQPTVDGIRRIHIED